MIVETRSIPGYERYTAKSDGLIIGKFGKVLKQQTDDFGYKAVTLYKDDKGKWFFVHRLILMTFVGLPPEGCETRHLDGDPSNNHIDNLEWGTHKQNIQDAIEHGTHMCVTGKGAWWSKKLTDEIRANLSAAAIERWRKRKANSV